MMTAAPKVTDVARASGLSRATVDRVLHNRAGASALAREKVAAAVQELHFRELPRDLAVRVRPKLRFLFILPVLANSFTDKMVASVLAAPASITGFRVTNVIKHVNVEEPAAVVAALESAERPEFDGVALFAVEGTGVREAIDAAVSRGLKVVSLVTDISTSRRHHFVGIDNHAAGEAAGTLMGRFLRGMTGRVAVIVGTHNSRDQSDRLKGFEAKIRSQFPGLRLLPAIEAHSERAANMRATRKLLNKYHDLIGLYSAGAGNTGIIDELYRAGTPGRVTFIMHELTDRARQGLRDGIVAAVINQDTGHMARSAVRVLKAHCLGMPIVSEQEKVRIDIYIAENAP